MILAATVSTAIAAGALLVDAGGAEASGTGASAEAPRATPHPLPSMGGAGHQPLGRGLPPVRRGGVGNNVGGPLFVIDNVTDRPITITYSDCPSDPALNCPWSDDGTTPGPDYIPAGGQDRIHMLNNTAVDNAGEIYINGAYGTVTLDLGVPANPFGTPTMSVQSATGYFPFICGIDNPASTPMPVMELFTTPTTPNHCG